MTLHLSGEQIAKLVDTNVAKKAARYALAQERQGNYQLPSRIDVDVPTGFFRVMPAALGEYMGAKIMTLARGVGNRYMLLVYRQDSGELLAIMDASEVTRLRTAATTALAGTMLHPEPVTQMGLIGTGFEAEGHLRAFAAEWRLEHVKVYSRSEERRADFAQRLSEELSITVEPVADPAEAAGWSSVTALCTKAPEPVVEGSWFSPGSVVLSIGATRPDLRELDVTAFSRAKRVLVDDPEQILKVCGDVLAAVDANTMTPEHLVSMSDWVGDNGEVGKRDLLIFKSVGTALQDLALASVLIDTAQSAGLGQRLGEITELKAAPPTLVKEGT